MVCGVCKKKGHNRRTCSQRDENESLNLNATRSVYSTSSTYPALEQIELEISIGQGIRTDLRDLKEDFKKLFLTYTTRDVKTESTDSRTSKNFLPVLLKDEPVKKAAASSAQSRKKQTKQWLNADALNRLDEGPSEKDGHGYIYMYKIKNPDKEDKNCYKIGLSKDLPSWRVQEKKNNEAYEIIASVETPYRYLTEKTVHRQLHSFNTPKLEGDGKTEWFTGDFYDFKDTIKNIV